MFMSAGTRNRALSEMNLTPLIDVLLVLLIIFMVVVPSRNLGERAEVPLPAKSPGFHPPPDLVVIQLHDLGDGKRPQLTINQQSVAWDGLEPRLQSIYRDRSEKVAFLKGDPEIAFQYVAEAVDLVHRGGAVRVGLLGGKN